MKPGQSEFEVIVESLRTISETQELHGKMLVALVHALDGPGTGESELITVLKDISVALKYQCQSVEALNDRLTNLPAQMVHTLEAELPGILDEGL
ncbi:hypothetical protein AB2M16_09615 [Acetobacter oryzifermentans]|uniref:hypothetical protein n=1 Tax=Acetobacter oryzifermentans TaxID=1633874 RepID=UPI003463D1B1